MKVGIYYPTWSAPWAGKVSDFDLSKIDQKYPGLNWVFLAFAKPDMTYKKGQNSFAGTGLDFSMEFGVVKDTVALLRSKNICVMLSVGGATYWSQPKGLRLIDLVDLVADLGVNGVDIDYESTGDGKELTKILKDVRHYLPKEYYLSMAGWSTGAFEPDGHYAGSAIDACKNAPLDLVNIMSYDAGPSYSPSKAWDAYKKIFNGSLMMGFETGQQGWGGYVLTADDVKRDALYVKKNSNDSDGIFVWCDKKDGNPSPTDVVATCVSTFSTPVGGDVPNIPSRLSITCPVCSTVFNRN